MKYIYQAHPFHLVTQSPWPIIASMNSLTLTIGSILKFNKNLSGPIILGITLIIVTMILWFRDIIRESTYTGYHTKYVRLSITIGFILFLISEVIIFISIFWSYFHSSLSSSVQLGSVWPPIGIKTLNQYEIPLTNMIILLTSGCTLTIGHNLLISAVKKSYVKRNNGIIFWLTITVILAIIFISLQYLEYKSSEFTLTDSVYGTTFFALTSVHGFHVIIGAIFLLVCLIRIINYQITPNRHLGFEFAIIYYHGVDCLFILIYTLIYNR